MISRFDEKEGHDVLSDLCASELDSIQRKGVHDRQFTNTESYALHHGTQHMLQVVNDHDCADATRANSVTAEQVYKYATDLELVYAKLKVKSTFATEDLLSLHSQNCSLLSDERVFVVTSLLSLLKKHSYILVDHPHLLFQCLINEGIPELSSSAAVILESSMPQIAYMKYLDTEEQKGADQARFECSDKIVCFDVSPEMDFIVCECRDGTIHLWSLQTGNKIWVRPTLTKKEFYSGYPDNTAYRRVGNNSLSYYRSVAFHPNGKSVLAGTLQFVYTLSGERTDLFPNSKCIFSNFVFCKDKKEILTDCPNKPKEVALWNMVNGEKLLIIPADQEIAACTISEDGSQVAFSQVTRGVILFDRVNKSYQMILRTRLVDCGLMYFTSDKNILVCGFLGFTFEEYCVSYKGFFYGPPSFISITVNSDPHLKPLQFKTFRLWPYNSSGTLDLRDDFIMQTITPKHCLYAGSYIKLDDESALVGSPACKYVTMINTVHGMAFGSIKGRNVKQIAFSLEGDVIYSVVPVPERKVKVTVLRMSSRDQMNTKVFPGSVSIFPTRDGIVLFKHDRVAELWSFDMSTCLRPLPNVTGCDIVSSVSGELIACCSSVPFYELSEDSEDLEDQDSDNSGDWLGCNIVSSVSAEQIACCSSVPFYELSEDSDLEDQDSDNSGDWLGYMDEWSDSQDYLTKSKLVINYLGVNRTKSTTVSSLNTVLDAGEEILSVFCINSSEVLVCTSKESEVFKAILVTVKLSLRKNGLIMWERTAFWIDPMGVMSHALCSSKHEFVVTWNTLEEGHGLHILYADTGETLHVFLGDQNDIVDCKFLDDESLVCCSGDNFLRLYNVRAGVLLSILDIGEQPFCLGACLYQPLIAIGLSGTRVKFVHVQLPKETEKTPRLVSFISLLVIAVD